MARVLLVDDNEEVRRAMTRALARMGHEVTPAPDGRAALMTLEGDPHDLVITDINMPEMDGIELIMKVAERWPSVPIIAMSGGGLMPRELLLENASMLGAGTTLTKPVDLQVLSAAVDRALAAGRERDPESPTR